MKIIEESKKILTNWSNTFSKSYGLVELFDTSNLEGYKIKQFLLNEKNETYIDSFIYYLNLYYLKNIIINFDMNANSNLSFFRLFIKCVCAYALLDFKLNNGQVLKHENMTINDFDELFDFQSIKNYFQRTFGLTTNFKSFYRGQSHYSWGLVPSFFRNFNFKTEDDGEVVDIYKMYLNYEKSGLISKYNETIATKKIENSTDLNYDFISYMQHSVAYSPLIDITSKFEIGMQFALGNKADINSFYGYDSALFAFINSNVDNTEYMSIDELLQNDFRVTVLKGKIKPGTIMIVENSVGLPESLDCTTIDQIIVHLTPKYIIIDNVKNDRMKYQHGKFILFYDYVLVNQQIMFALNNDFKAIKFKITTTKKNTLYKNVNNKFPQYNMDYLMNPYDYFKK
ncbi:MAG: FRG domain-containing protein [Bacilli bacterium]|nr:FRG domain-containing protein [Bacilli bacterium]